MKAKEAKKPNKKNGKLSTILFTAVFIIGLCILLYPTISNFWNEKRQSQAIINYDDLIVDLTAEDYSEHFKKAEEYNSKLRSLSTPFLSRENLSDEYYDTFDINGDGMMGYVTIEKINVQLPVYHGTADKVLNSAIGHIEGSSLPTGGKGTHCVLSAHRGLPSAKLFTNLDELTNGDIFTIKILDRTLTYQVDQIQIVLPEEINELYVTENKDYCTLITCTPYGINTHRLLVRGTRIANIEEGKKINVITEAYQIDPLIVTPIAAIPMLGGFLIYLVVSSPKSKKMKKTDKKSS